MGKAYKDLRQHTYSLMGMDFDPDISLNNKWLVYASTANSMLPDIYIKSTNGTMITRLTTHPDEDIHPCLSPDSQRIAWASRRNGNWDIFVKSTHKASGSVQITRTQDDDLAPCWSPDGTKICYSSRAFGEWKIWIYDFTNQSLTSLGPCDLNRFFSFWH